MTNDEWRNWFEPSPMGPSIADLKKTDKRAHLGFHHLKIAGDHIESSGKDALEDGLDCLDSAVGEYIDHLSEATGALNAAVSQIDELSALVSHLLTRPGVYAIAIDGVVKEVATWCDDSLQGAYDVFKFTAGSVIVFELEQDLIMFRMRWVGERTDTYAVA